MTPSPTAPSPRSSASLAVDCARGPNAAGGQHEVNFGSEMTRMRTGTRPGGPHHASRARQRREHSGARQLTDCQGVYLAVAVVLEPLDELLRAHTGLDGRNSRADRGLEAARLGLGLSHIGRNQPLSSRLRRPSYGGDSAHRAGRCVFPVSTPGSSQQSTDLCPSSDSAERTLVTGSKQATGGQDAGVFPVSTPGSSEQSTSYFTHTDATDPLDPCPCPSTQC